MRVVALIAFICVSAYAAGIKLAPTGMGRQMLANLSGTWVLDEKRNGPAREVWFSSRARKFVMMQLGSDLTIDADGSIADVATALAYKLDGSEIASINHSAGDIPGWTRKIRTKAMMDGETLVTHTSHVSETTDGATGKIHENVSVTIVLSFTLSADGHQMTVTRTGFRPVPPVKLHGRPYKQEDDLLYQKDRAIYAKSP